MRVELMRQVAFGRTQAHSLPPSPFIDLGLQEEKRLAVTQKRKNAKVAGCSCLQSP